MTIRLKDKTNLQRAGIAQNLQRSFNKMTREVAQQRLQAAVAAFRGVYQITNDRRRFATGPSLSEPGVYELFIGVAPVNPLRVQGLVTGESRSTRIGGRAYKRIFRQGENIYQRRTRRSYPLRYYYYPIRKRVVPAVNRALRNLDKNYRDDVLRLLKDKIE